MGSTSPDVAAELERVLKQAVVDGTLPHAAVVATNGSGSFDYHHAVGVSDMATGSPATEDTIMQLASSTKLVTSIAALQIVERGLIGLDDDVAPYLPELAEKPILKGFDEADKPILEPRRNTITLRHLLTHSSGVVYDAINPNLMKLQQQRGRAINTNTRVLTRFDFPLLFEPGTSWEYGPGIDWTALLVERLAKSTNLDAYMREHIFAPLGIKSLAFFPPQGTEIATLAVRSAEGRIVANEAGFLNDGSEDCFGGHGLHGSTADYARILKSILVDDGKLLQPSSVAQMFTPQLSAASKEALNVFRHSGAGWAPGHQPPEYEADYGLGSMIYLQTHEGRRKKGTLHWAGMANTFWLIDREADLALAFGTQLLPPGDPRVGEVIRQVELAVYKMRGVEF